MAPVSKSQRSTESRYIGVGGGIAQHHKDMPEESKQYLTEVERRDMEMEQIELTRVGDGVNQLKQIAVDMNERVKVQNTELDPIAGQLTTYREDMGEVNKRLKAAARKGKRWGSFGRNLLCMLLLVGQIIALGYLIEFVISENRKH